MTAASQWISKFGASSSSTLCNIKWDLMRYIAEIKECEQSFWTIPRYIYIIV